MKKNIPLFITLLTVIVVGYSSVFAQEEKYTSSPVDAASSPQEFHGKIGTTYVDKAEKFGLDIALQYFRALDPWFAFGGEIDILWVNWERKLAEEEIGLTVGDVKAETDAFVLPFFFNVQIRIPPIAKKFRIEPMVTIGLGYSIMLLDESIPEYEKSGGGTEEASNNTDFYHGFAWQVIFSGAYRPVDSNIYFMLDLGYRGNKQKKDNIELDMSGFLGRIGVRMNI